MFRRLIVLASTALITGVLAGCGNTDSWVDSHAADGWPAQYGDAANSSYARVPGAEALNLEWSRSVKGELGAAVALGSGHYLAVNAQTLGGCSLMVWEADNNARQRWCTRLWQGGGSSSPLWDGFDNLYIGQPGAMMSFPPTQWIRWRQPVIGMPTTPRILAPGQLLVVTHLGQVLLFDAHRGTVIGTPLDLVAGVNPTDSQRGLADCRPARPRCPVAVGPRFRGSRRESWWYRYGSPVPRASVLVGLKYNATKNPRLSEAWISDAVKAGVISSPVASADGSTIYVNGRDNKLWALNTSDGKPKWSTPLGLPPTDPAVGVARGPDHLRRRTRHQAGRDQGWRGQRRGGVDPRRRRTADHVQPGRDPRRLQRRPRRRRRPGVLVFDPADGRTVNSYPLPEAEGWPVGVSIGHDRRVVIATSAGQVYGFGPA